MGPVVVRRFSQNTVLLGGFPPHWACCAQHAIANLFAASDKSVQRTLEGVQPEPLGAPVQ